MSKWGCIEIVNEGVDLIQKNFNECPFQQVLLWTVSCGPMFVQMVSNCCKSYIFVNLGKCELQAYNIFLFCSRWPCQFLSDLFHFFRQVCSCSWPTQTLSILFFQKFKLITIFCAFIILMSFESLWLSALYLRPSSNR